MEKRANEVLHETFKLLKDIEKEGLFSTIEKGIFANIKRPINGGKGLEGVIEKQKDYYNPFIELISKELNIGGN